MNITLTKKQKVVLAVLKDLTRKQGKVPTLEEMTKALGYSAVSSVQRHLDALKKKEVIRNEKHHARSLEINVTGEQAVNIPLVGNISAGMPLLAEENIEAYIPYNGGLLHGNPKDYFFLRAVGDSMNRTSVNGKNIQDSDYVLVHKQQSANPGDRVIALLGDEAVIKKLQQGNGHYILQPESSNPQNKPIYIFDDFIIQGIACDVMKKERRG